MKQNQFRFAGEKSTIVVLFFTLIVCYAYFFPRWADPNQNSRLDMIVAVVEDGTFQIDRYVGNTVDYAKFAGHYYSDKAPGMAFLGIPIYAGLKTLINLPLASHLTDALTHNSAFNETLRPDGSGISQNKVRFALAQVVLSFLISLLPTALLCILVYRLLGRLTTNRLHRIVVTLGYGLLTPVFAYANTIYGHQLSAVLLFSAFYLLFMHRQALSTQRLLAVGLLLGYSVVTEYPSLLMVIVIYLYAFILLCQHDDWRRIGWITSTGSILALGWLLYNKMVFGGMFHLGYDYSALWVQQHHTGFLSLTAPHWDALWGITFGRFRGLFVLSPWLLLFVPGVIIWWRSHEYRAELLVALSCILVMVLFNSASIMWWGGFAVGPRYLLPMLPFMAVITIFSFRLWRAQSWFIGLSIVLFTWSFITCWGLTLADQAFPSDTLYNPLVQYAWPNWVAGNIARNVGTIIGLNGIWSLAPLAVYLIFASLLLAGLPQHHAVIYADQYSIATGAKLPAQHGSD